MKSKLARATRFLGSRRTALVLLVIFTALTAGATFLPHPDFTPGFTRWQLENPSLYRLFISLGFIRFYSSYWFIGVCLLLLASTASCLPRMMASVTVKTKKSANPPPGKMREFFIPLSPAEAEESVAFWLRERGIAYRLQNAGTQTIFSARKRGRATAVGALMLHAAILVLATGGLFTALTGYRGNVTLIEGQSFADTPAGYAAFWSGPLALPYGGSEFTLLSVELEDPLLPQPAVNAISLEIFDPAAGRSQVVTAGAGNSILYRGLRLYPRQFGFAPLLSVTDAQEQIVLAGYVGLLTTVSEEGNLYTDRFTLGTSGLRAEARFFPARQGEEPSLELSVSDDGGSLAAGRLLPGERLAAGGLSILFDGYRRHLRLHVVRDIGFIFFALGSFFLCLGIAAYYFRPALSFLIVLEPEMAGGIRLAAYFAGQGEKFLRSEFADLGLGFAS